MLTTRVGFVDKSGKIGFEELTKVATAINLQVQRDLGPIWNVRAARELAWDFADHLRSLGSTGRDLALDAQDKLTGVIGRSLLLTV